MITLRVFTEVSYSVKECTECGTVKILTAFQKNKRIKSGYGSKCKDCVNKYKREYLSSNPEKKTKGLRNAATLSKYGISKSTYYEIMNQAGDTCPTCKNKFTVEKRRCKCLDHCHNTGKIRGVICNMCNTALGRVEDNTDTLTNLINWIK